MRYSRGHVKNHLSNKKHIAIYALSILLIASVYFYSNTITGYVAYTSDLEMELNQMNASLDECAGGLDATRAGLDSCTGSLLSAETDVQRARSNLAACESSSSELIINASKCGQEKEVLKLSEQFYKEGYDALSLNAARSVCCRPGLASTAWDVLNHSVVCVGNRTLNCTA